MQVKLFKPDQPLPMQTFIERVGADSSSFISLLADLKQYPPSERYFLDIKNIKYAAAYYKESKCRKLVGASETLAQIHLSTFEIPNGRMSHQEAIDRLNFLKQHVGYSANNTEGAKKCYLIHRALVFSMTKSGACSFRSAYAAIQLATAFAEKGIKTALISAPSKDQYTVMLGNSKIGWTIYDPLLNPELVFPHKFYQENILPRYPDAPYRANTYKLIIKQDLVDQFHSRLPALKKTCSELLAAVSHEKNYLGDIRYAGVLPLNKIQPKDYKKITADAVDRISEVVNSNSHQLSHT